jgi:hypothetical protein
MSSISLLLTNNINNIDLIDYFVNNVTMPMPTFPGQQVDRTLLLYKDNQFDKCKGVVVREGTTYTKEETREYASAIVTDQTFINNLTYFINMFSVYIDLTTVNIEGTSYVCNSYISLSGKKYYILGTQPMTQ